MEARRDVLHDADGGIGQAPGCCGKPDERNGGDDARGDDQQILPGCAAGQKGALSLNLQPEQEGKRHRQHEQRLQEKAVARPQARLLADQAIEAEAKRQADGDPGKAVIAQGQVGDTDDGQSYSRPLQASQSFTQKDQGDQDIDQGIEIVAEADLEETTAEDRDNEYQPVEGDEKRRATERQEGLPVRQSAANRPAGTCPYDQRGQNDRGPEHTVRQQLERADEGNDMEVDGGEAPEEKSGEAEGDADEPLPILFRRRHRSTRSDLCACPGTNADRASAASSRRGPRRLESAPAAAKFSSLIGDTLSSGQEA